MSKGYILQLKSGEDAGDGLGAAYNALKSLCLADAWWFGWNDLEMRLPRRFSDEALQPHWDTVRVFTSKAELRAQRAGNARLKLLLTESQSLVEHITQLLSGCTVAATFCAQPSCRILVGQKPRQPVGANPDALIEAAFPRELDYEGLRAMRDQVLVADVQCYYDDRHRLHSVRYCTIQPEPIGNPQRTVIQL